MIVDGKVEKTLKQHDVIVMRRRNHEWVSRGNELARFFVVLVPSKEVVTDEGEIGKDAGWGYF